MKGVHACSVDVATGTLTFQVDTPDFDIAPVAKVGEETGHTLVVTRQPPQTEASPWAFLRFLLSNRETTLTVIAGGLTVLGLLLSAFWAPDLFGIAAFALAIGIGSWSVARSALQELIRAHMLGINALMVIAVSGAIAIGEWSEAAIVVVLFSLGEARKATPPSALRRPWRAALLMTPVALRLLPDGSTSEGPVEQLSVGERVLIGRGIA
jgi:Cd2+/Zn2+-exporting ATPase